MPPVPIPVKRYDIDIVRDASPASRRPVAVSKQKKRRVNRKLTPAKLDIAWKKVCHVVQGVCKERGCMCCHIEANRIEFQLRRESVPVRFVHDRDRIQVSIRSKQWTLRIVRIKTSGSAYELRQKRLSATRMVGEVLILAGEIERLLRPTTSDLQAQERQLYIQQLTDAVERYDKKLNRFEGARGEPAALSSEQQFEREQLVAHRDMVLAELHRLQIDEYERPSHETG